MMAANSRVALLFRGYPMLYAFPLTLIPLILFNLIGYTLLVMERT